MYLSAETLEPPFFQMDHSPSFLLPPDESDWENYLRFHAEEDEQEIKRLDALFAEHGKLNYHDARILTIRINRRNEFARDYLQSDLYQEDQRSMTILDIQNRENHGVITELAGKFGSGAMWRWRMFGLVTTPSDENDPTASFPMLPGPTEE